MLGRQRTDILERKVDILQWIEEGQPKTYIAQQLNCKIDTLNSYLKKMGIDYKGQQNKKGQQKGGNKYKPALYYINNHIAISSDKLKKKMIKDGVKEARCEICGLTEWQGKPIPLELHHINGNHYDNTFSNLMILCPNCHAQQTNDSNPNKELSKDS